MTTRSIDTDLIALRGAINALLDDGPPSVTQTLALRSAAELQAEVDDLRRRTQQLLDADEHVRSHVEDLLTDGCAGLAAVEAQRLRTKGRLLTLLGGEDPAAGPWVRELCERYEIIVDQIEALRALITAIRAQLDLRDAASA